MKKTMALLLAGALLCSTAATAAAADSGTKYIGTAEELAQAISQQQDGQHWVLASGEYDLSQELMAQYADIQIGGQGGFYFPITADDLTVTGSGDTVLTSSYQTANGAWATQNFITVEGDGVTLQGLDLHSKQEVNKAIEVLGQDVSLRDLELLPTSDGNSGSIYFNPQNDARSVGSAVLQNVSLHSWISARSDTVAGGTIALDGVTVDFTGLDEYAASGYGPISQNSCFAVRGGLTVKVDDSVADLQQQVVSRLPDGTRLELADGTYCANLSAAGDLTVVGSSRNGTILLFDEQARNPQNYGSSTVNPVVYGAGDLTLCHLTVTGPAAQHGGIDGVYGRGDLHIEDVAITDIRCEGDGQKICGVQCGKAILAAGSGDVTVLDTAITDFQKQAIDVNTSGHLTVSGCEIRGAGKQGIIAQNGIVVRQGSAQIQNTAISELVYEADNEWSHGSVGVYALGGAQVAADDVVLKGVDNTYAAGDEAAITVVEDNITYKFTATSDEPQIVEIRALEVKLDLTELKLEMGATARLGAVVEPANTTLPLCWSSSNEQVATVKDGLITATGTGETTITATVGELSASCAVVVTAPATEPEQPDQKPDEKDPAPEQPDKDDTQPPAGQTPTDEAADTGEHTLPLLALATVSLVAVGITAGKRRRR
ncbi:Ig-like domain-containing protein [Neobittarella massiliensis]|uniref:Ig-like domain-containing protein n=1 Tax=Neobittarella massiliensis (ex Bilen et al. 2018) TaxID=2041842 RepID=A0A8J6IQC5_9FIRM|nr:Ig-like domain-containing protein [Neobittarella massiliensis]MBC3516967.1 Ig-like domain-containing protein [Neobittarella massiliensis]